MKYSLIDQADIDVLPDEDNAAFVEFQSICGENLSEILASLGQNDDWSEPCLRYMTKVGAAALEYDVLGGKDLPKPNAIEFQFNQYLAFENAVAGIVTRLQIKNAKKRSPDTVKLPASRAAEITKYVEVLRRRIEDSDFDDKKKEALYKRLEALKAELTSKGRTDLSKTLIIIASIATTLSQAEAAVIKLPDAIAAVMKVIGYSKDDEDAANAEQAAIAAAAVPKVLEDKRPKPIQSQAAVGCSVNLDDEIPF